MRNTVTQPRVLATVPSKSNPNKKYEIRLGGDGVVYCTCVSWQMNKNCKHLEEYHSNCQVKFKPGQTIPVSKPEDVVLKFFKDQVKLAINGTPITKMQVDEDLIYKTVSEGIINGRW